MKPTIPPAYREVLIALRDNPLGLSTAQIFKWCTDKGHSELKNTTVVSYIISTLRDKKRVMSINVDNVRVHKITDVGRSLVDQPEPTEENPPVEPNPIDAAIAIIRAHATRPVIVNLSLKIEVLDRLVAIVSDDIRQVLLDIKGDLKWLKNNVRRARIHELMSLTFANVATILQKFLIILL